MYGAPTSSSWLPGWTIAAEAKARTPLIRFGQSTNGSKRERRQTRSSHRASRTGRRNGLGPYVPTHRWRSTRELEARTTPHTSPAQPRNSRCDELGCDGGNQSRHRSSRLVGDPQVILRNVGEQRAFHRSVLGRSECTRGIRVPSSCLLKVTVTIDSSRDVDTAHHSRK